MNEVNAVQRHRALCDEINALYERKNHDYGDIFHLSFQEEGWAMVRIRLGDKFNRFKTLSKANAEQRVDDESMRDTLMDLANYAMMAVMEIDRENEMVDTAMARLKDMTLAYKHPEGVWK